MTDRNIFMNAPAGAPPGELEAYIDEACGRDVELKMKVHELFASAKDAPEFLEHSPLHDPHTILDPLSAKDETPGDMIGNYKLLQQIGEGGFGVVYMADQLRPVKRRVALKIIKLGMDTRQVVARFEAERQALAMMDHPNIAKVLDAGATENGRPYFVMELVRGTPITDYCDENHLNTAERLALFRDVCRAVQHAHQKGIIHRDLKPSNVMVTMHDDKAVPKVIDFGVAKATQLDLTDKTLYTRYEQFIGTPAYMSPEQAQMSGLDIDTRSDIYALGVLLYELLTGTTPYNSKQLALAAQEEVRRVIREEEPPKPSTRVNTLGAAARTDLARRHREEPNRVVTALQGDLDWIVMKALEKDRKRRYETANAFAEDVRRFLENEPVSAAAPSVSYRFRKYARRHRTAFTVATCITALLFIGTGVSTWLAIKATDAEGEATELAKEATELAKKATKAEGETRKAKEQAVESRDRAAAGEIVAKLQVAEELLSAGQSARGVAQLAQILRQDPDNRVAAGRLVAALTQREWPFQVVPDLQGQAPSLDVVAGFSEDGTMVAQGDRHGVVHVWEARTGKPLGAGLKMPRNSELLALAISPDGTCLVATGVQVLVVWDLKSGKPRFDLVGEGVENFQFVEFSPDSRWILTGGSTGEAMIINSQTGERLGDAHDRMTHSLEVMNGKFSADGRMVVTGSNDGTVCFWKIDVEDPAITKLASLEHSGGVWAVDLSKDGRRLVAATHNRAAHVWAIPDFKSDPGAKPERIGQPLKHQSRVMYAEFSPDEEGARVVTASFDGTARVWESATGMPVGEYVRHANPIFRAKFNHNGSRIVTGSEDGTAQVWDVETSQKIGEPFRHHGAIDRVEFSPGDGSRILTAGTDGVTRIWEARQGQPRCMIFRHRIMPQWTRSGGRVGSADFSPDSSLLLTAAYDGLPRTWNVRTGRSVVELPHPRDVNWCQFIGDGTRAVTISSWGPQASVRVWQIKTGGGQEGATAASAWYRTLTGISGGASFSSDGEYLLAESKSTVDVVRVADGERVGRITTPRKPDARAFSRDGRHVVTGGMDGAVHMWELSGKLAIRLGAHGNTVNTLAVSGGGSPRVATGGSDKVVKIWDPTDPSDSSRTRLLHTLHHEARIRTVAFSPDGRFLAVGGADGIGKIWEVEGGRRVGVPMHHANQIRLIRFSRDGRRVVTASYDGSGRIWDAESGLPVSEPLLHDDACIFAMFSPDGRKVVTTGMDATARVWDLPPAKVPVPEWVAEWAEAAVGFRMNEVGVVVPVEWEVRESVREKVSSLAKDDYQRWAEWFYAPQASRPLSPFTDFSLEDYLADRIAEESAAGLAEAARLSADWGVELGKMARRVRNSERQTGGSRNERREKRMPILGELVDLSRRVAGPESRATLRLRERFAGQLQEGGHLTEARDEFLALLTLSRKVRGDNDRKTLQLQGILPEIAYWNHGDRAGALERQKTLVERWQKIAPRSIESRKAIRQLARWAVALEDWELARDSLRKLIDDAPEEERTTADWMKLAALYLWLDDRDAHRELCERMVKRYGDAELAGSLERTAKAYFAAPLRSDAHLAAQAAQMARRSTEVTERHYNWMALCRGMAEFRMENDEEALKWLTKAEESTIANCLAVAHPYHAMAAQRAGKSAEARDFFRKAETVIELLVSAEDRDLGPEWHDRIFAKLALEEAREMLGVP